MPTINKTIGSDWGLIALDSEDFYVSGGARVVEVATVATQANPTVEFGHPVSRVPVSECNRALIGPGFVYAKSRTGDVDVPLTTWLS